MRVTSSLRGTSTEPPHQLNLSDSSSSTEKIAAAAKYHDAALALLAEYSNPETSEHCRAELQCAALSHCEASLRENTQAPLSIPLAVLAAHAERISDAPVLKAQIEQNVLAQLPDAARPGDASGLLDTTCAVPSAVMLAAVRAVPLFSNTRMLSLPSEGWPQQLAGLHLNPGGASAVLIHAESQWMLALLTQSVAHVSALQCVLFGVKKQPGTREMLEADLKNIWIFDVPESAIAAIDEEQLRNLRVANSGRTPPISEIELYGADWRCEFARHSSTIPLQVGDNIFRLGEHEHPVTVVIQCDANSQPEKYLIHGTAADRQASVPDASSVAVQGLRLALPQAEIETKFLASSVQNADGILCLAILVQINRTDEQMLASPRQDFEAWQSAAQQFNPFDTLNIFTEPIDRFATDWHNKDHQQQMAFVVAQRAELLQTLAVSKGDLAPNLSHKPAIPMVPILSIPSAQITTAGVPLPAELARLTAGKGRFTYADLKFLDPAVKTAANAETSVLAASSPVGQATCEMIATTLPTISSRINFVALVDTFTRDFETPRIAILSRIQKTAFAKFGETLQAAVQITGGEVAKAQALLEAVDSWLAKPENADSKKVYAVMALRLKLVEYAESEEVRLKMSPDHHDRLGAEVLTRTARGVSG